MGKKTLVEIGSYTGASACCLAAALQRQGTGLLVCIDTWHNDGMSEGPRDTWAEFQKNISQYAQFVRPVRGLSWAVVDTVREIVGKRTELLFIDGDHSYEGVRKDWELYRELLTSHATVVFHDWGWARGVQKVIQEEVIPVTKGHGSLPNMWWGSLR